MSLEVIRIVEVYMRPYDEERDNMHILVMTPNGQAEVYIDREGYDHLEYELDTCPLNYILQEGEYTYA